MLNSRNLLIIIFFIFTKKGLAKISPLISAPTFQILVGKLPMRNVFPPQMSIGQRDIADIKIDVSSRDDIPVILLGLQHIFTTQPLRDAVFKILEEVAPTKMDDERTKIVSINKGRPGIDQWSILVLGSLRVGLNTDYDRIL